MKKNMLVLCIITLLTFCIYLMFKKKETQILNPNPRSENSFVGDVMPFYDDGWKIFYLEDHRDGNIGFHPFSLFTTNNFTQYIDNGVVIPYVNDESSQERALGTGSIIKDEMGLYHAFYTAHNQTLEVHEAIMHATSSNLTQWDKHPEDTFFGDSQYERNDFRDPFVFFNQERNDYWMLITTRLNGKGVIVRYISEDLLEWKDHGVFFENDMDSDANLECPSLIFYKGMWYLSFSDQWPDRVTHYRISKSLEGPYEKPAGIDHWDASAFYAGQMQKDDDDTLFVFGWVPTKVEHDNKNYAWAGNLVIHQLTQKENGALGASVPISIQEFYQRKEKPEVSTVNEKELYFSQQDDATYLKGSVSFEHDSQFVFSFNAHKEHPSALNIVIEDGVISYHNNYLKYVDNTRPLTQLALYDPTKFDFELLINDDIITFYINGTQAFTNRMILAKNNDFKFSVTKGNANLTLE